jgi:hypothetical protein
VSPPGLSPDGEIAVLELGVDHAEFRRLFPHVVSPMEPVYQPWGVRVEWPDGGRVGIALSAEKVREIAGLRLPYLVVEVQFSGFTHARRAAFMARFARSFHKGGG